VEPVHGQPEISRILSPVTAQETARRGGVLWQRLLRTGLLGSLISQRSLISAFAQRDFRTRYRSSAIGWTWSLLQPLASLAVFAVVFTIVFKARAPELGNGRGTSYVLYLFTGLVAWNMFLALINLSMTSLRESGALLRKVAFPAWAPVLGSALVQLIQAALEISVLLAWFLVVGNRGWTWLYAPFLFGGLALFTTGLGLMLSTANARFGDVQYIVGVVLSALYFLTPVLYPVDPTIPKDKTLLRAFISDQPVSLYVKAIHDSLYSLAGPGVVTTAALGLVGATVFVFGLWVFDRTTEDVGELL
jgi:ABC-type polysaccharide/polyol phosphate export permease